MHPGDENTDARPGDSPMYLSGNPRDRPACEMKTVCFLLRPAILLLSLNLLANAIGRILPSRS